MVEAYETFRKSKFDPFLYIVSEICVQFGDKLRELLKGCVWAVTVYKHYSKGSRIKPIYPFSVYISCTSWSDLIPNKFSKILKKTFWRKIRGQGFTRGKSGRGKSGFYCTRPMSAKTSFIIIVSSVIFLVLLCLSRAVIIATEHYTILKTLVRPYEIYDIYWSIIQIAHRNWKYNKYMATFFIF